METLVCNELSKTYGSVRALDHVDLKLEEGKIVGLLGPNGSGKTTLIKLASRLLVPTEGEVRICGELPSPTTKAIVSYLPDRNYLPDWMKTKDLLEMYQDFYGDFDVQRAQEMLGSLNIDYDTPLKNMSKGTKEKVQLILTMSRHAKLYLLDEPIAGVDPAARDYILKTIISNYDETATVLISTHLIADVENVLDEAVFLKEGKVVLHQSVDELRDTTGKSVDEYFREVFKC
ncbi:MAG: ABC transporter ATP-binding protein [Erysipelotrichaceae bacterium]|nr:ABC transporter ATP-binding protein [Erysipelotrichaceae bacterium]MBQ5804823.1 ABC transporter ATP-binding protein [Erysipelotrichaceae bacterium]